MEPKRGPGDINNSPLGREKPKDQKVVIGQVNESKYGRNKWAAEHGRLAFGQSINRRDVNRPHMVFNTG